jgi:hypothetical protein
MPSMTVAVRWDITYSLLLLEDWDCRFETL